MGKDLPSECDECGMVPAVTPTTNGSWCISCPNGHISIQDESYEKAVCMWNKLNEVYESCFEK
jgi:hypothetical protein